MANLLRTAFGRISSSNPLISTLTRSLTTSRVNRIKEITITNDGKTMIFEGKIVPSPRTEFLVKPAEIPTIDGKKPCYMCALGLDVKHTDVLILSQFVRSDGCMLPRRITGLCSRQQKKMGKLVTMAQKAGLMINLTPDFCNKDPTKRNSYKKYNTYFDESTIFQTKKKKVHGLMRFVNKTYQ